MCPKASQHASPHTLTPADANLFGVGSQSEKNMQSTLTDLDTNYTVARTFDEQSTGTDCGYYNQT